MNKTVKSEKVPKAMQSTFDDIVRLTDNVSRHHLNDEYAQLIRLATAALCRKRPSPLTSGKRETWACGIAYAIGSVNFLFDKNQVPSMSAGELCKAFGVNPRTGSTKSKVVRDTLDLFQLHPDWCLPSQQDSNPLIWTLAVDGLMVDVRDMPREIQEIAYKRGLIPYIPSDREDRSE